MSTNEMTSGYGGKVKINMKRINKEIIEESRLGY